MVEFRFVTLSKPQNRVNVMRSCDAVPTQMALFQKGSSRKMKLILVFLVIRYDIYWLILSMRVNVQPVHSRHFFYYFVHSCPQLSSQSFILSFFHFTKRLMRVLGLNPLCAHWWHKQQKLPGLEASMQAEVHDKLLVHQSVHLLMVKLMVYEATFSFKIKQ